MKIKKSCEREIRGGQAHHKEDTIFLPIAIIKDGYFIYICAN
ncbi:hypothetical protein [Pedobacter terrae]